MSFQQFKNHFFLRGRLYFLVILLKYFFSEIFTFFENTNTGGYSRFKQIFFLPCMYDKHFRHLENIGEITSDYGK